MPQMCNPCLRTGVTYVPGPYNLEGGGIDNWITVTTESGSDRLRLRAREKKIVPIHPETALTELELASEGSFRPSELDRSSGDHRALGVLVRPFDLSR